MTDRIASRVADAALAAGGRDRAAAREEMEALFERYERRRRDGIPGMEHPVDQILSYFLGPEPEPPAPGAQGPIADGDEPHACEFGLVPCPQCRDGETGKIARAIIRKHLPLSSPDGLYAAIRDALNATARAGGRSTPASAEGEVEARDREWQDAIWAGFHESLRRRGTPTTARKYLDERGELDREETAIIIRERDAARAELAHETELYGRLSDDYKALLRALGLNDGPTTTHANALALIAERTAESLAKTREHEAIRAEHARVRAELARVQGELTDLARSKVELQKRHDETIAIGLRVAGDHTLAQQRIAALETSLAEAQRDSGRMDWLESKLEISNMLDREACQIRFPLLADPEAELPPLRDLIDTARAQRTGVCSYCTFTQAQCEPLWAEQRKCCPDCTHGRAQRTEET